jgi:hypothetical protein
MSQSFNIAAHTLYQLVVALFGTKRLLEKAGIKMTTISADAPAAVGNHLDFDDPDGDGCGGEKV